MREFVAAKIREKALQKWLQAAVYTRSRIGFLKWSRGGPSSEGLIGHPCAPWFGHKRQSRKNVRSS